MCLDDSTGRFIKMAAAKSLRESCDEMLESNILQELVVGIDLDKCVSCGQFWPTVNASG